MGSFGVRGGIQHHGMHIEIELNSITVRSLNKDGLDIRIDEQIKKIEGVIEEQTECLKCLFFFSFLTVPRFSILFFFFPLIPSPGINNILPSSPLTTKTF